MERRVVREFNEEKTRMMRIHFAAIKYTIIEQIFNRQPDYALRIDTFSNNRALTSSINISLERITNNSHQNNPIDYPNKTF